jgi:hypothetical protein
MNGSRVLVGSQSITASSVSVYVGNIDASPNNHFSLAIYTDSAGAPGALVAQAASGTLNANSWNSLPISATLSANTAYWIFFNTDGSSGSVNNTYYNTDPSPVGAYSVQAQTFGTWPSSFGSAVTGGWRYSIYITGS